MRAGSQPTVVVVGAGFGGLRVAERLAGRLPRVLVLDRQNFHCFIPLLYQVATAGLEPEEIAQPVRRVLRGKPNVRFRMADVRDVDFDRRLVLTDTGEVEYDYLVLAAGSATNFFGIDSLATHSFALRHLSDATALRNHVLRMFEQAILEPDPERRQRLMTIVVVGGGPTGVELAGALAELKRHVLPHDFPDLDLQRARVVLLEATASLLPDFSQRLKAAALRQLQALGVEVQLNSTVARADAEGVLLRDGDRIACGTVAWVAGLRSAPLADRLDVERGQGGRVVVKDTLQLPTRPEVCVIGDMAYLEGPDGSPYPMVAPVAIQQGELVASNIERQMAGQEPRPFVYRDRGMMVTVGRQAAVASVFGVPLSGFPAWVVWLTVHLIWLIGFRNRLLVLVNWIWNYFTYERGSRLITDRSPTDQDTRAGRVRASRRARQR